jgi:A/G-specific adenine glycosylase
MLQQTQVVTVVPYYERFLRSFPTIADLAAADEAAVLRHWEGLGYYRRARALHQAAQLIVADHQGKIADDPDLLRRLPGLGRYTVNAILSQAFDRRLPILEANSRRVLCRLLGIDQDPSRAKVDRLLWQTAESLLPRRKGAGRFNQALMELGALVCTPRRPNCEKCPLSEHCVARQLGRQEDIPFRPAPPAIKDVDDLALVIRKKSRVLIVQRPSKGRWASLWEFPHLELTASESHTDAARRLLAALELQAELGEELLTIRHGVTRFRITLVCLEARHRRGTFRSQLFQQGSWVAPAQLQDYPFSSPQRRLAQAVV